jgi:Outer membrane protein beta-barrel domain
VNRAWAVLAAVVLAVPASVSAGNLTLRGGGFFPRAESTLFTDDSDLYTRVGSGDAQPPGIEKSDWVGFSGGIAYFSRVAPNVELGVSIDGYERQIDTSYRNYTRPDSSEILQTLRLRMVPIGLSLRIGPTSRRARLAPYLELGGDAISYKYEEFGDFIDFFDDNLPVVADSFVSEGFGFGFHVAAGLKVPINHDFSIVGEGRYQRAKDQMGDDFRNHEIDLSGWSATVGFNIRF